MNYVVSVFNGLDFVHNQRHILSKIYDKQDNLNFEIVNFPFLDGDVPPAPLYGLLSSQLIHFARICSNVSGNLFLIS